MARQQRKLKERVKDQKRAKRGRTKVLEPKMEKKRKIDPDEWLSLCTWMDEFRTKHKLTMRQFLQHFQCPEAYFSNFWSTLYPDMREKEYMLDTPTGERMQVFVRGAREASGGFNASEVPAASPEDIAKDRFYMKKETFRLLGCSLCYFKFMDTVLRVTACVDDTADQNNVKAELEVLFAPERINVEFELWYPAAGGNPHGIMSGSKFGT